MPGWLWILVEKHAAEHGITASYLFPGVRGRAFVPYHTFLDRFQRAATAAGLPAGYAPHQLRHSYASAMLAALVPISDLAAWLGHRDINVTYGTYGHLVPDAWDRGRAALEAEYAAWVRA